VVLPQIDLTKLKLEYLKLGKRFKHKRNMFASLGSTFFEFSSSLLLEYGR